MDEVANNLPGHELRPTCFKSGTQKLATIADQQHRCEPKLILLGTTAAYTLDNLDKTDTQQIIGHLVSMLPI